MQLTGSIVTRLRRVLKQLNKSSRQRVVGGCIVFVCDHRSCDIFNRFYATKDIVVRSVTANEKSSDAS